MSHKIMQLSFPLSYLLLSSFILFSVLFQVHCGGTIDGEIARLGIQHAVTGYSTNPTLNTKQLLPTQLSYEHHPVHTTTTANTDPRSVLAKPESG